MTNKPNPPVQTLRDGFLAATIWRNLGDNGNFYSVEFSRTYKDDENQYHDSHSFSGSEPLRLARLAEKAYDRIVELRQQDNKDRSASSPQTAAG